MKFEREEIFLWRLNTEEDMVVVDALIAYASTANDAGKVLAQGLLAQRGPTALDSLRSGVALLAESARGVPVVLSELPAPVPTPEQLAAARAEAERFQQMWGAVKPAAHEGADR